MSILEERLKRAADAREGFVTIELYAHHPEMIARTAAEAEALHWHVKAVWRGEAAATYILFRYTAP